MHVPCTISMRIVVHVTWWRQQGAEALSNLYTCTLLFGLVYQPIHIDRIWQPPDTLPLLSLNHIKATPAPQADVVLTCHTPGDLILECAIADLRMLLTVALCFLRLVKHILHVYLGLDLHHVA